MRKNPLSNMSAHGGIITSEFLENIRSEKVVNPRIQPDSFATSSVSAPKDKRELKQQIEDSWDRLRERWDAISNRYLKMNLSDSRSKWMIPLLRELGFDPIFNREDIIVDGDQKLRFKLSHKGWNSSVAPIVHMVLPSQDLEEESHEQGDETSRRGRNRSPHDELQTFLNVNRRCKWGIVTNGILLRILREYFHTTTMGYVEFDVENIFRERSFNDFRALYRMAHASRFLLDKEGLCHLEQFYDESVAAGVSVGENLRRNVKKAIEALGNGFLAPDSAKRMIDDEEFCRAYYSELLRVVYRFLFLLFAEQRAMLPTRDSLYVEEYSITRLREMAETRRGKDEHTDLWEGLKVTFQMLKNGCPPLKVFGYNGSLFDDSEIPILSRLTCKNEDVLAAIHHLTLVEEEKVLKRINYLDLGVEEIGSIYESLLDFLPKVFASEQEIEGEKVAPNTFFLDPRGAGRKTTGSYYTNPRLIDGLIKSALKSVVDERVGNAVDKDKALLSIKICDPACGSGAFLIAANNYLARELAKLRTKRREPSDRDIKSAVRDVLQHCVYGVDLNPMAVELAKVSLWINSCIRDMPLNFLDHHLKCGNSLIGATPRLIRDGLPDAAFAPVEGDDKDFAKRVESINKLQKKQRLILEYSLEKRKNLATGYAALSELEEKSMSDVEKKKLKYASLVESSDWASQNLIANTWAAAFYWPLSKEEPEPPTSGILRMIQEDQSKVDGRIKQMISKLASQCRFFHWHLEFPDIFGTEEGGFDCILGNPPWERIKLQQKEFFETRCPEIANAAMAAERKKMIEELSRTQPKLWEDYLKTLRMSELEGKFIRSSERYDLTGGGDINTYAVFAELARDLLNRSGLAGIIVPTGIATDNTNKNFFADLVDNGELWSLFDFENKHGLFPEVHRSYKFSLLTMGNLHGRSGLAFSFFLTTTEELESGENRFCLTKDDFILLNPNTRTAPIFRKKRDAELTKAIYRRVPILVNEQRNENSWHVSFLRMIDMANDSNLFKDKSELEKNGFVLQGNAFHKEDIVYLPLYEGKMVWIFNHRAGSISYLGRVVPGRHDVLPSTTEQLRDPFFVPLPRFWVNRNDVFSRIPKKTSWFCGFRDITNAASERTSIFSIIPLAGVGHQMPLVFFEEASPKQIAVFVANVNSLIFDYIARQKLGGNHMTYFILKQLPILPLSSYDNRLIDLISSRVLELSYTGFDLQEFARDFGYIDDNDRTKPPFKWEDERRLHLQCELDAIYFSLYKIPKEDVEYILETFSILKKKDLAEFAEYRTKTLVLKYFDEYAGKLQIEYDLNKEVLK